MHPIIFNLGGFELRSYGVFVALGFLTAFFLMYQQAKKNNFFPDKILDLEFIMLISGIVGARALHVLVNLNYYSHHLLSVFFLWRGGLAFCGGLIVALFASWIFIIKQKLH